MVEQNGRSGSNGTNGHGINGAKLADDAEKAWQEALRSHSPRSIRIRASSGFPGVLVPGIVQERDWAQKAEVRKDHGRGHSFLPGQG